MKIALLECIYRGTGSTVIYPCINNSAELPTYACIHDSLLLSRTRMMEPNAPMHHVPIYTMVVTQLEASWTMNTRHRIGELFLARRPSSSWEMVTSHKNINNMCTVSCALLAWCCCSSNSSSISTHSSHDNVCIDTLYFTMHRSLWRQEFLRFK